MVPPETTQIGSQRGWRLDHASQDSSGTDGTWRIGGVDAVATGQRRRHQGHHLVAGVGSARSAAQVNVAVYQLAQTQTLGQSDRQDQPRIGHQAVVIKGDVDAVGALRW